VETPTLKAIHIYNSLQPPHKPKFAKEYGFTNASKFAERKASQVTKNSGKKQLFSSLIQDTV
jgi:hypothetical protein